jgi:hypothetical protein
VKAPPPRRLPEPVLVGVAHHPLAARSIRRAKSFAGLAGFGLTLGLGLLNDALLSTACLRALGAGVAAYLIVWGISVTVWRHLLRAQAREAVAHAIASRSRSVER